MTEGLARLGLVCCLVVGCSDTDPPPTRTIVIVDAEEGIRGAATRLRLRVESDGEVQYDQSFHGEFIMWPRGLTLEPLDGDPSRSFDLTATAYDEHDGFLAQVRAISGYESKKELALELLLEDSCIGVMCSDDETCGGSKCLSAEVDPTMLEQFREQDYPDLALAGFEDEDAATGEAVRIDASTDLEVVPDSGPADGGTDACVPGGDEVCDGDDNDCDGDTDEGKSLCTPLSNAKQTTAECVAGQCFVNACLGSRGDCNGDPSDGCETDRSTDALHCGACGRDCNTFAGVDEASCEAEQCVVDNCKSAFLDCDGDPDNGCEWNTLAGGPSCRYERTLTIDNSHNVALASHQVRVRIGGALPVAPAGGNCDPLAIHDGHGYFNCNANKNWGEANDLCHSVGMTLARINDQAEQDFVDDFGSGVWLGARDSVEGQWRWRDDGAMFWTGNAAGNGTCSAGTSCTHGVDGGLYENWGGSAPDNSGGNEDCLVLSGAGPWQDDTCTDIHGFVCETELGDISPEFWEHVDATGDTLRIVDNAGAALPFWVEEWDFAGQHAIVWIRVPLIPAHVAMTVRMQYGGTDAGLSDIGATMIFGDEFNGPTVDSVKNWDVATAGNFDIAGGNLRLLNTGDGTTGRLMGQVNLDQPYVIETRVQVTGALPANGLMVAGVYASNTEAAGLAFRPGTDAAFIGNAFVSLPAAAPTGQFQAVSLFHHASSFFVITRDEHQTPVHYAGIGLNPISTTARPITLGRLYADVDFSDNFATDIQWRWVAVRKFTSPQPQVVVNDDETVAN